MRVPTEDVVLVARQICCLDKSRLKVITKVLPNRICSDVTEAELEARYKRIAEGHDGKEEMCV
jgi:hypothetical protein